MWKASLIEAMVRESGEVVPVGEERRALQLFNPGLGGRWATTNTMIAAVQLLLPGEVARAHRHTPTAIRFIMEGAGAYTAVDGERVYMAPGDLILTPSWAWHDHGNETDGPRRLDGRPRHPARPGDESDVLPDLRRAPGAADQARQRLGARCRPRQPGPDLGEGAAALLAAAALFLGADARRRSRRCATPTATRTTASCSSTRIRRPAARAADDGVLDPDDPPRRAPPAHRHTGSAVYYVVEGTGETIIDGRRFVWGKGDILVLPSWALHEHANTLAADAAVLFSIQDRPGARGARPLPRGGAHGQGRPPPDGDLDLPA